MRGAGAGRPLFWVASVVILAGCVEAGSHAIEFASTRMLVEPIRRRSTILREKAERIGILLDTTRQERDLLDPVLGWGYRAGFASETDHINARRLRARREYDSIPSPGVLRVAAFGDSFVYGMEVRNEDAWCAILETESNALEVLNYGVGGYGLDQAFLRFQGEGMALRPDVVIIGFAPDDLGRIVNVYRRFISSREWPLTKPRFVLRADGTLELVGNPLPSHENYRRLMRDPGAVRELGPLDWWYSPTIYEHPLYDATATLRVGHAAAQRIGRRYFHPERLHRRGVFNERSTAFNLHIAVFRAFAEAVRAKGAVPVILMFPDRESAGNVRGGAPPVYAPLRDALVRDGLTVWDAADAFRSVPTPVEAMFAPGGHYSAVGNGLLASWVAPRLDALRATAGSPASTETRYPARVHDGVGHSTAESTRQ